MDSFAPDSNVKILIDKIIERQKEIQDNKSKLLNIIDDKNNKLEEQEELLAAADEMGKLNAEEFGKKIQQEKHKLEREEDHYEVQNALKVERQR